MTDFNPQLLHVLAVVGLFFLGLFVIAVLLSRLRGAAEKFPYRRRPILSPAEANFHAVLQRCLPRGTALLAKVRLADFLEVTLRGEEFMRYFGKISQKHTDFLLIDAETAEPLLAVELDDSTHRNNKRTMESDRFKNNAYEAAGLSILRVPATREYDERALRTAVNDALRMVRERQG